MLTVKFIRNFNNAPVVTFFDEFGTRRGLIVSREAIGSTRIGEMVTVEDDYIKSGTDYGIDLDLLFDDITIPVSKVQEIMRSHGLWTTDDFQTMRKELHAASLSLASEIVRTVESALKEIE